MYWNWNVGNILASYIKYVQSLIRIIREKMEHVPNEGFYGGDKVPLCATFDSESHLFAKSSKYKKITNADFMLRAEISPADMADLDAEFSAASRSSEMENNETQETDCLVSVKRKLTNTGVGILQSTRCSEKTFCDRHLFSYLCYRNFAHLADIPFIQSVQRVTFTRNRFRASRLERKGLFSSLKATLESLIKF